MGGMHTPCHNKPAEVRGSGIETLICIEWPTKNSEKFGLHIHRSDVEGGKFCPLNQPKPLTCLYHKCMIELDLVVRPYV